MPGPSPESLSARGARLFLATRSEILGAIAAVFFLAAVLALRLGPNMKVAVAAALAICWVLITLVCFRRRVWLAPAETLAAPGVEFYRLELEQRRKHLLNPWLWHGPLVLGFAALAGMVFMTGELARERLYQVSPLAAVLAVWTMAGIRKRRREAEAIGHELGELPPSHKDV